jgi:hypothetical protein
MNKARTPIAVFTYNRPAHTEQALRCLERCRRLAECDVHIFCDAAKNAEQSASVVVSRKVVRAWADANGARVIERDQALGCAHSIVSGVTELVNGYGEVIVLEDDLTVSPDFINFLLQALDRYRNEPRVAQISASQVTPSINSGTDAFFLPFAFPTGWATWSRAWKSFDWTVPGWESAQSDPVVCNTFDHDGSFEHCNILRSTLNGETDAWDIRWEWSIFREKKLVLFPRKSLVRVGGFDGSGTNCGATLPEYLRTPAKDFECSRLPESLSWPETITVDDQALRFVKRILQRERNPNRSLRARVQRTLQSYSRALRATSQESM